jgi:hypothetical protein
MEYFILKPDGEQTGTYSIEQIRAMLNSGIIDRDARYWHEGISDWQPVDRIEESLDFPEPDPHDRRAPPPHKWSGSLARAIPSPYQAKRQAAAAAAVALSPPLPAAPAVPEVLRPPAEIPEPSLHLESSPPGLDDSAPRAAAVREIAAVEPQAPAKPRRRWVPRPTAVQVYAVSSLLLTAAIVTALVESRHPARSPLSHVRVTSGNHFVLTEQASIKPFEDDMRNSPVIARLRELIAKSTDASFKQVAGVGLQQEIAKHESEVTQKYLDAGKAEVITPGTYDTVAYLDDNGALVPAQPGEPWAAIKFNGSVFYVYLGTDFHPLPPP